MQKFAPTTKSNLIKTKKEFVESKLEDISMDPDIWIQGLETLRRRLKILGHKVSKMDLIIHIMNNLPQEYETTIEFIENELETEIAMLERVKEKLRTKFERLNKSMNENEKALVSFQKYKGHCSYCGKYGHMGVECRKRLGKVGPSKNQSSDSSQDVSPIKKTLVSPVIIATRKVI